METNKFSPEQSFELINQVIIQARSRFEENGFIYLFWGILIGLTSISQFILLQYEFHATSWFPYLLMPFGVIYTTVYYSKRLKKYRPNLVSKIISALWLVVSINIMILGFLFGGHLQEHLIPIILILLSVGTIVSGTSMKSQLLLSSGVFIGIAAILGFYIEWIYHPLLMGIVAFLALFLPGIILMVRHKRKENV